MGGPPCGPWIYLNSGTHKRTKENIWGDLSSAYVQKSNQFPGLEKMRNTIFLNSEVGGFHVNKRWISLGRRDGFMSCLSHCRHLGLPHAGV